MTMNDTAQPSTIGGVGVARHGLPFPLAVFLLLALFAAWMAPGLVGRDPWKADEAYSFGLVLNMMQTGDLVVPTLGSDPFMEKPPVFYMTSALFAKVLSPPLALHEAARASCVFFMLLTLLFIALGSRRLNGPGTGWLAALLLMGSLGLVHTAHMLQTDLSLLAGCALGLYGLLLSRDRPWSGGLLCGTGAGLAFLSKGLLGPGAMGVTVLCLPLLKPWRDRNYWRLLGGITLATLPWVLIWPLALYHRSPVLFMNWFWDNNLGRFMGTSTTSPGKGTSPFFYLRLLPGFAWPVCPLALWVLWRKRLTAFRQPNVQLVLLSILSLLLILSAAWQKRSLYATPLIIPLALLAVPAVLELGERVARILNLTLAWLFSVLAAVAWLGWAAQFTGWPSIVLERIHKAVPGYAPGFNAPAFVLALAATLGWLALLLWRRCQVAFVAVHWTAGVALIYLLGMTLWLPLTNCNMTYRQDFVGLREALGADPGVIASRGLDEPQRAMVHYYAGIKPLRVETRGEVPSRWMLVQGVDRDGKRPVPPGPQWRPTWNGRHHSELFTLYHREDDSAKP